MEWFMCTPVLCAAVLLGFAALYPPTGYSALYENAPRLYSSPLTGEGGVGVIFILRCAPIGHGG